MINEIFDLLDAWRNLPAYQLERRADIYFAVHLNMIIKHKFGISVECIIPEFPVRIGNIQETSSNQSFKIDYLAYSKINKRCFLIELKTDMLSLNEKQHDYLKSAANIKLSGLIDGLIKIYSATTQKRKYDNLIQKVENEGLLMRNGKILQNKMVEIKPEVIYIQPENIESREDVIDFDEIASYLSTSKEPLTQRFLESLRKWKSNPNKK